jgi:hypothetical protein
MAKIADRAQSITGMRAFYPSIDAILWGRKTYDWGLAYYKKKGTKVGMFDSKLANYVFSRKPPKRGGATQSPQKTLLNAPQSGCPLQAFGRSRTASLNPQRVGRSRYVSCDMAITSTESTIGPVAHLVHSPQCCYAAGGDQTWHISTVSIQ